SIKQHFASLNHYYMVLLIAATVRVGQQVRQHLLSIMYAVRHIYELWAYVVLGDETMNGSRKGIRV
ncbi:TPA: hypothetical protein MIR28_27645, partial [Klebsiella pneumoniae]|nr:hypothetical protein [Klebsiella pneumoniae]